MKRYISCVLLLLFFFCSCKQGEKKESRTVFLLGTVCNIQIFTDKSHNEAETILNNSFSRIENLDRHLSANAESSTLITINKAAGISAISITSDIYPIFERAAFFAEKTLGAFNPVIGSVVKLWNIGFENEHIPSDSDIKQQLAHTDYNNMHIANGKVFLKTRGMKLDLGAIAKGFAADEVARIIQNSEIKNALIDIGGTITAMGNRPNGKPWIIGIRDPRKRQGEPVISVSMSNRSISTSGTYERFFEQNGIRYHHIIDPATGYPVRNNLVSVSIFSDSAADADALSTACFVLGYEKALSLLSSLPNTDGIFIFNDNSIYTTKGFKSSLHILNKDFKLR